MSARVRGEVAVEMSEDVARSVKLTLMVPADLRAAARRQAKLMDTTVSREVRRFLGWWVTQKIEGVGEFYAELFEEKFGSEGDVSDGAL